MYANVCACEYGCPWRPEKALDLLELELKAIVSYLVWMLGPELSPPQEQQVLIPLSSPLPCIEYLKTF